MTIHRRTLIQAGAAALTAGAGFARAQTPTGTWPSKPLRLIVGFPPGGGLDAAARLLAEQLQIVWGAGHSAYVENKPGGSTIIAAQTLLASPRDGHSFLVTMNLTMLLPYLGQKLAFDPVADLLPVAPITLEQLVLVVSPALEAKTFDEVISKAKANPKAAGFGSFSMGSVAHILGAQIAQERRVDLLIAPYRGASSAVQGVLSGEVAMALSNPGTVQQHIAAGKLVPIGMTGPRRSRFFPDVPTFKELGISGMEAPAWTGVFAPRGTAPDVIQKMAEDMRKALQAPAIVQKYNAYFQEPGVMSTEEFRRLVKPTWMWPERCFAPTTSGWTSSTPPSKKKPTDASTDPIQPLGRGAGALDDDHQRARHSTQVMHRYMNIDRLHHVAPACGVASKPVVRTVLKTSSMEGSCFGRTTWGVMA